MASPLSISGAGIFLSKNKILEHIEKMNMEDAK
jgi:hypothetical protein